MSHDYVSWRIKLNITFKTIFKIENKAKKSNRKRKQNFKINLKAYLNYFLFYDFKGTSYNLCRNVKAFISGQPDNRRRFIVPSVSYLD